MGRIVAAMAAVCVCARAAAGCIGASARETTLRTRREQEGEQRISRAKSMRLRYTRASLTYGFSLTFARTHTRSHRGSGSGSGSGQLQARDHLTQRQRPARLAARDVSNASRGQRALSRTSAETSLFTNQWPPSREARDESRADYLRVCRTLRRIGAQIRTDALTKREPCS